ncbi:MAG: fibronectin type III domain-containing protein [Lachnospiraceae bacterium]|nr:fibronectin type III domain-containing protein [Lachnospiraceae bacterium]
MKKKLIAVGMSLLMVMGAGDKNHELRAQDTPQQLLNPIWSETNAPVWDCVYFGGYWQSKCEVANMPTVKDTDQAFVGEDGKKYLLKKDGICYSYEPIKWRILEVNGTDAFLVADKNLDQACYSSISYEETLNSVEWQNSHLRAWLNDASDDKSFLNVAFSKEEQEAIITTTVNNQSVNPWSEIPSGEDTQDKVYVLSIEEARNEAYGFMEDPEDNEGRCASNTDFITESGGSISSESGYSNSYWLRSGGLKKGYPSFVGTWGGGNIVSNPQIEGVLLLKQNEVACVRPVLHLDLSKTTVWSYAGRVTWDGVEVESTVNPNNTVAPERTKEPVPTLDPTDTTDPTIATEPAITAKPVEKPGKVAIKNIQNSNGKKLTVTIRKEAKNAVGYQVVYATKKSFKNKKSKTFDGTSVVLSGLKKGKSYYVKVRAYNEGVDGRKYGAWSTVKKCKTKQVSILYETDTFSVQLPLSWKNAYIAIEGIENDEAYVAFYSKQCQKEDEEMGWLFSISEFITTDYEEIPSYSVIATNGDVTYVATYPTDVQSAGLSKKANKQYFSLIADTENIIASFQLK